MSFYGDAFAQAWDRILSGDPYLMHLVWVTLKVACYPTAVALLVGVPIGVAAGIGRGGPWSVARVLANAGLGLPPVIIGLMLLLLSVPQGPLGRFHIAYNLKGVYIAQLMLCLPIIIALTSSAVRDVAPGLLDQARAFGAGRMRVAVLATREARVGIIAATIASLGSGMSEVGAVVLIGGNITGETQTLASAALSSVDAAHYIDGMAIGIILLGLVVVVTGALTWLQYGGRRGSRVLVT